MLFRSGGQGIVLASKLIAQAAMDNGMNARTAETIGMAQRGGCVVSHVRIGQTIWSPLVPLASADFILAFEPAEAVRNLPYLKQGGMLITAQKSVIPVTASLTGGYDSEVMPKFLKENVANARFIDTEKITDALGTTKALNVVMLGAACALQGFPVDMESVEKTIVSRLPERFHELNKRALCLGAQYTIG